MTEPAINTWWPQLSIEGKQALRDASGNAIPEPVRDEIRAITGRVLAADAVLSADDVTFIRTQEEPVD